MKPERQRSIWMPLFVVLALCLIGLLVGRWSDAHMGGDWLDLTALVKVIYWGFFVAALALGGVVSLLMKDGRAAIVFFVSLVVLGGGSAALFFAPGIVKQVQAKNALENCAHLIGWSWKDEDAGYLTVTASVRRGTDASITATLYGEDDIWCAGEWTTCQAPLPPGSPGSTVEVSARLRRRHPTPFDGFKVDIKCPTGIIHYGTHGSNPRELSRPLPFPSASGLPSPPSGWQLITKKSVAGDPFQALVRPASFEELPSPVENAPATVLHPGEPAQIGQWVVGPAALDAVLSQVPRNVPLTWWHWYSNAQDRAKEEALFQRILRAHPGTAEAGFLP